LACGADRLRQPAYVLYLAIDPLISLKGRAVIGLAEFTAAMAHGGVPVVWVSNRTRLQLDDPRRKVGHSHPFIAEGGCGAYLPEGYFHLRPERTVRLGRFICIPVAEEQPAAAEVLDELAEASGVNIVPLRSLSPRELSQNSGLPPRQAELLRQRDFDEFFFLAGASEADARRLRGAAQAAKVQLREDGVLWSAAVGASVAQCVRELTKLYERALRHRPATVAVATASEAAALFPACDRQILLSEEVSPSQAPDARANGRRQSAVELSLRDPDLWEKLRERLTSKGG
jgi:predicted mannosyl-3-phosphoglycerate phosphatase (HAD superfamily)